MNRKDKIYYKIAKYICNKNDQPENTKYLAYFLEINAFQLIQTISILVIAWVFGIGLFVFVTMIGFFIGRSKYAGYHAKNLSTCVLLSTTSLIGLGLIGSLLGLIPSFLLGIAFGIALRKKK